MKKLIDYALEVSKIFGHNLGDFSCSKDFFYENHVAVCEDCGGKIGVNNKTFFGDAFWTSCKVIQKEKAEEVMKILRGQ